MDTNSIKSYLVATAGGTLNEWKRVQKFKFSSHKEFAEKELNNALVDDLKHADINKGTIPASGNCRVFVACIKCVDGTEEWYRDTTAYVITPDDDSVIAYLSVCSD